MPTALCLLPAPALHVQLGKRVQQGGLNRGVLFLGQFLRQTGLGALAGLFGLLLVDVVT